MDAALPDWIGVLTIVVCLGGSVAFGLFLHAGRRGGRAFQAATDDLMHHVAQRARGEFRPSGEMWSLHRSMRVFDAAGGTRAGFDYEASRYPLNVEDDGGRPYLALRPHSGRPALPQADGEAPDADPVLEQALGRRVARRLSPAALIPLRELVRESNHLYQYQGTLIVVAPHDVFPPTGELVVEDVAAWVERVLDVAGRLYPS